MFDELSMIRVSTVTRWAGMRGSPRPQEIPHLPASSCPGLLHANKRLPKQWILPKMRFTTSLRKSKTGFRTNSGILISRGCRFKVSSPPSCGRRGCLSPATCGWLSEKEENRYILGDRWWNQLAGFNSRHDAVQERYIFASNLPTFGASPRELISRQAARLLRPWREIFLQQFRGLRSLLYAL